MGIRIIINYKLTNPNQSKMAVPTHIISALPAHTQELIMARANEEFKEFEMFLEPLTDDQKVCEMEKLNNLWNGANQSTEEFLAESAQLFNKADKNMDGRLCLAEYKVWEGFMRAKAYENDTWYETDHSDENYVVCNSINEGK